MQALEGETCVGYAVIAEIRCFLSLGIDPDKYEWIDLHAEFRQLVNETDWKYGWQWHQDKKTEKWKKKYYSKYDEPEYVSLEDDTLIKVDYGRTQCKLINAKLKFLGVDSDPHLKDEMRALILQDKKRIYR